MTFFDPGQADISDVPQDESSLFGIRAGEAQADVLMKHGNPALQAAGAVIPALGAKFGTADLGEQIQPLGKAVAGFYQQDRDTLINLQTMLYNGGWYPSSYYKKNGPQPALGVHDEDTYNAYVKAARTAARFRQSGRKDVSLGDVIMEGIDAAGGAGRGSSGPTRAPLTITLTNPADIRKVGDTVAQNLLGRALSDSEANSLVAGYQTQERAAQTNAYGIGAGGGTSIAQPSAETFAEQQLRAQHPVEVGGHDARRAIDEIFRLFSGGGS